MKAREYMEWERDLSLRIGTRPITGSVLDAAVELPMIARKLNRISERQCNGYDNGRGEWDEAADKRDEKREERLVKRAQEIAGSLGATLYVQGDPRGLPLYLIFPGDLRADRGETIENAYSNGLGVPV